MSNFLLDFWHKPDRTAAATARTRAQDRGSAPVQRATAVGMPCRLTFSKGFSRRHGTRTADVVSHTARL
jgi:hypothetical protein